VMRTRAQEARQSAGQLPLYYTEWSISSNPRDPFHDGPFAAAFALKIALSVDDLADGYSYWTFTDIFEENYFPSVPYHGGFGMMNLYGVPKPIYRAFEMLRRMGDRILPVEGQHATVSVSISGGSQAFTTGTQALLINHALPRHEIAAESVRLRLLHGGARMTPAAVTLRRIDSTHANPEQAWRDLGAPEYPSPAQVQKLMAASVPQPQALEFTEDAEGIMLELVLAPQSVNSIHIEWQQKS